MCLLLIKQNKYTLAKVMGKITQTHTLKSLIHFFSNFSYPLLSKGEDPIYALSSSLPSLSFQGGC